MRVYIAIVCIETFTLIMRFDIAAVLCSNGTSRGVSDEYAIPYVVASAGANVGAVTVVVGATAAASVYGAELLPGFVHSPIGRPLIIHIKVHRVLRICTAKSTRS